MAKFVYLYFGGRSGPTSPEIGKKTMEAWMAYFGKLGSRLVDGGAPFGAKKAVGGSAASGCVGYTIVTADSLDQAVALTAGHPHLEFGGQIEVCEAVSPPGM